VIPGKAMMGLAVAMLLAFGAAPAHAGPGVKCQEKMNSKVDHKGTDGSECFASSDGTGGAKSKAAGAKSFADAEIQTGGKANAVATGGSFSEAIADTGSHSISNASNGGSVTATSDKHGVAKGTASGSSEADPSAFGKCHATAKATGLNSLATAECLSPGTFAHATATGGGKAHAFSNASPSCVPNAGTAHVHSSGGDC
jgi:hypothetical protein